MGMQLPLDVHRGNWRTSGNLKCIYDDMRDQLVEVTSYFRCINLLIEVAIET